MSNRFQFWMFAAILLLCASFANGQTVYPFMGLGNAQFFDNNGKVLTAGMLYSYQAGTTTQQATYTDSTGLALNPNPIPFGSGARVAIWLTGVNKYKFVLCLQNDGAACAPADVLFSVDQVPGCPVCTTGGTTFIGTFISGTPNPATTGILELATTDTICWRNQAGTANLCITKDASDILSWTGSTIKLPEIGCATSAVNFDYLCPNSATHHLSLANNGTAYGSIPTVATAAVSGRLASFTATGLDLQDSGGTPPAAAAVTFSATPTFAATSQNQLFTMTLTGNVSSSTLTMTSLPTPSQVTFELTQDGTGGRTFVWPANVLGAPTVTPTIGAVTVVHTVWDGTNARAVSPTQPASFNAPQSASTAGLPVAITANTQITVLTKAVTFPSLPGTYRADIRSGVWITAGPNACASEVIDATNTKGYASANAQNANGSGFIGLAGSQVTSQTYTAGQVVTFNLAVICNAASSATLNWALGTATLSPNPNSFLDITPILTN